MPRAGCYNDRSGYTLIELLLALAVLSVVATIVLPSFFRSYFQHRSMDQAVSQVMEAMLTTKQLAVRSATPHAYEFVGGSNKQFIYSLGTSPSASNKQVIILPEDIQLEVAPQSTSRNSRMIFREDGSTEGIELVVVGPSQTETIQVHRRIGIPQRVMIK